MFRYDYKGRKEKLEEILKNTDDVKNVEQIPNDDNFTYTNAYNSWVTSIFIDIRKSTELIKNYDDLTVAKVFRGFTSEVIEILRSDADNLKEIGIRGDCVYGIYSTPYQKDIYNLADRIYYLNTYINMLNSLLSKNDLPNIEAGIGVGASETLIIKAGRKSSGINDLVWIGDSVPMANNLANIASKDGNGRICMSSNFFSNYSEYVNKHVETEKKTLRNFKNNTHDRYGNYYHASLVMSEFDKWIAEGMPVE